MKNLKLNYFYKNKTVFKITTYFIIILMILFELLNDNIFKTNPLSIDMSSNKVYSLSKETKSFIKSINKDVKITILNSKTNFVSNNYYFANIDTVINEYSKLNKISVNYINIENDLQDLTDYPTNELNKNDIIIQCDQNYLIYPADELFSNQDKNTIISSIEQQITSGIYSVLFGIKNVSIIQENNKKNNASYLINLLKNNGYNVNIFSNLKDGIDTSPDMLILFSPYEDFSQEDTALIDQFLEQGKQSGKALICIPNYSVNSKTPNLNNLFNKLGINIDEGIVYDPNHIYKNNIGDFFITAEYVDNEFLYPSINLNKPVVLPSSRPISIIGNKNKNVKEILKFSSSSGKWLQDEQGDEQYLQFGNIPAVVLSSDIDENNLSHVMVISSSSSFAKERLFDYDSNNYMFYLNLFNILSGKSDSPIIGFEVISKQNSSFINILKLIITCIIVLLIIWILYFIFVIRRTKRHE